MMQSTDSGQRRGSAVVKDVQYSTRPVGERLVTLWRDRRPQFILRPLITLVTAMLLGLVSVATMFTLGTGYTQLVIVFIVFVSVLTVALVAVTTYDVFRERAQERALSGRARVSKAGGPLWTRSTVPIPELPLRKEVLLRLLDILGALLLLIFIFPTMLLAAVLIKVTSPGPILYRQERVGKNGKLFHLYKFRTITQDAETHIGPIWASETDARVTPVGRILRRTRLNELPQLFNILRGDMSLVGPRPKRSFFVERHKALQGMRLAVRPGLTGLAQVRSYYDLKPAHTVKYDYLYIQHRSVLLNIYILLQTIPVLFTKKGW